MQYLHRMGVEYTARFLELLRDTFPLPQNIVRYIDGYVNNVGNQRSLYPIAAYGYTDKNVYHWILAPQFPLYFPAELVKEEEWVEWDEFENLSRPFRLLLEMLHSQLLPEYTELLQNWLINHFFDPIALVEEEFARNIRDKWSLWEMHGFPGIYEKWHGTFATLTWLAVQTACDTLLDGEYDAEIFGDYHERERTQEENERTWWPCFEIEKGVPEYKKYVGIRRKEG